MAATTDEETTAIDESTNKSADGRLVDEDGITFLPFDKKKHMSQASAMTLKAYPFPENFMCIWGLYETIYGVAAVHEETGDLAGYYIAKGIFPGNKVGIKGKKVANLAQICTSSNYQKRGIAKRMGKYMMDGCHPEFDPADYDEIIVQDTDAYNSPSWLFSDRCGFRYFPTIEVIKRFGILGYIQLCFTMVHVLPGQFLKRYIKSDEEKKEADKYEEKRGVLMYFLSGILPSVYWVVHYVISCRGYGGVDGAFVSYIFGVVYLMFVARFLLGNLSSVVSKSSPPVFREYDFWWGISSTGALGWAVTIFTGFPLLGYTGGFYMPGAGVNYFKEESKRAIAMVYLPINLLTLLLFLAHTLLRVFSPSFLAENTFVDVLGHAAFYFSITDLAMFTAAFPSGTAVIRRWNFAVCALLWLSWLALLIVTIVIPEEKFLYLYDGACKA